MTFPQPLLSFPRLVTARFLRRYKRFLTDVRLEDGTEVTVHCPNPGRMSSILPHAETVYLSDLRELPGKRKLDYRWELAKVRGELVVVNTQLANRVAGRLLGLPAIREDLLLPLESPLRSELRIPGRKSRFDFGLSDTSGRDYVIEVKQVSMRVADQGTTRWAAFPDAVTARGKRHLEELAELSRSGATAILLYVVGRSDVNLLRPAYEVDPHYSEAFERALEAGVTARACRLSATLDGLYWDGWLSIRIGATTPRASAPPPP
ncbi:MAG: DNA/RNA nuclease SfsA [Vulcanimicrobiota bacterium]